MIARPLRPPLGVELCLGGQGKSRTVFTLSDDLHRWWSPLFLARGLLSTSVVVSPVEQPLRDTVHSDSP
jgi:hypothetical protein